MKILQLTDYFYAGINHPSNYYSDKLYERGHDVEICTSVLDLQRGMKYPIKIRRFSGIKIGGKLIYPGLVAKIISQENPDIIHSHVMGFFSTFAAGYLKPLKRYHLVVNSDFDENESIPSRLKWPYTYFYRKLPASFADVITTYTERQKSELVKRFGLDDIKIEVLPSGIDTKPFFSKEKSEMREKLGLEDKFVVLNVCFISPKKNLELTLKALRSIKDKDVVFVHAGGVSATDGKYEENIKYKNYLESIAKRFGISNKIIFLDHLNRQEIIECFKMADVFLQTSFYGCITIVEAMAAGKPVITPKSGVAWDVIKDGKTGFTISNEDEIRDKIMLLKNSPEMRRRIGKAAQKVAKEYDWERIVDKLECIYKRIL